MTKEVENIILNKSYDELSAEELEAVHDLVSNAEEYEEMKWFLLSTKQALASDKIKASPKLRKSVMEHLNQDKTERKFWLNSVVGFLFPEDKAFYQKPAFQLSMAALLVIGFLIVYNPLQNNEQLAINNSKETEEPVLEPRNEEISDPNTPKTDGDKNEFIEHTVVEDETNIDESSADREIKELEKTELKDAEDEVRVLDNLSPAEGAGSDSNTEADWVDYDGYYADETEELTEEETAESSDVPAMNTGTTSKNNAAPDENRNTVLKTVDEDVVMEDRDKADDQRTETVQAKKKERRKLFSRNDNQKAAKQSSDAFATTTAEKTQADSTAVNEKVTLGGAVPAEEQETEPSIRPYSMHVNEAKELKQLFTTFK